MSSDNKSISQKTLFKEVIPYEVPVDGVEIYFEIIAVVEKHCVVSKDALPAIALWIMYTIHSEFYQY